MGPLLLVIIEAPTVAVQPTLGSLRISAALSFPQEELLLLLRVTTAEEANHADHHTDESTYLGWGPRVSANL